MAQVIIKTEATPGGAATVLANAWVYWRAGGSVTVLRTNGAGLLMGVAAGGDPTQPWRFTQTYSAPIGAHAELFHTLGARPMPAAALAGPPAVFVQRTLTAPPLAPPIPTPVTPTSPNTIVASPTATIVIPAMPIALTRPSELAIWPLLWEPTPAQYATSGLSQQAAAWGGSGPTVTENASAPAVTAAAAATDRAKERGLRLAGTLAIGVTGVKIQLRDRNGGSISLLQTSTSTTPANEITGTLGATSSGKTPFEATLYFENPSAAFGVAHIIIIPDGVTPPQMASFTCLLAGIQIALVADASNGQTRGPVPSESDEKIILDFQTSPQATLPDISAQTRVRRMVAYDIGVRTRVLGATTTAVLQPEMPMWMAELQLLGVDQASLEDLLVRRSRLPTPAGTLTLTLEWSLALSWDGPDAGTTSPRRYQYSTSFGLNQSVRLALDATNHIDGINAQGGVPTATTPNPGAIAFPVANRRRAMVVAKDQTRAWGRQSGATSKEALIVEWQPRIVDGDREIMRGGDGVLALTSLTIDAQPVDAGVSTSASPAPASLPSFRVRGVNPPTPANAIIDALVEEYVTAHAAVASVALLTLPCWQETCRRILAHEAGHQFEHRGAGRRRYGGLYYGHEQDMPIFGGPHGYGYGQHDNPPVSDDGAWSFIDNLRESVRRIIKDKGSAAYGLISQHLPATIDQRTRAVFQREVVRRYNGQTEFRWNAPTATWVIHPSLAQWADPANHAAGPNPELQYTNKVLSGPAASVAYFVGTGAATTFPWPITFVAAQFGPGT